MAPMEDLLAATRGLHFCACIVLFGELLYGTSIDARAPRRQTVIAASVVVAVLSALGWLALAAAGMSGEALPAALRSEVLRAVLLDTQFGQAWTARIVLLVGVVVAARRAPRLALVGAGAVLGALAWMGHAGAATGGGQRAGELGADAAHLLAAGAWLGTLPALAAALRQAQQALTRRAAASPVALVQRYSRCAMLAVAVIVLTGVVNTRFRVGTLDALVSTGYGRVLLLKLALVVVMLAIAAFNRVVVTRRLRGDASHAVAVLRRNAVMETILGVLVIAVVGILGITPPAAMGMAPMVH